MEPVVLASASPRRRELLNQIGVPFIVCPADIDESMTDLHEDLESYCSRLARNKIEAVVGKQLVRGSRWFLGADTVVAAGRRIYGKPRDREEAHRFLKDLSGRRHKVVTGICLYDRRGNVFDQAGETATVRFAALSDSEIEWYLETGEWQGAAGGYRIQEKAACFIESIQGNYSTVMGLPIRAIYVILKRNKYPFSGIQSSVGD
jgi:septum formation protein